MRFTQIVAARFPKAACEAHPAVEQSRCRSEFRRFSAAVGRSARFLGGAGMVTNVMGKARSCARSTCPMSEPFCHSVRKREPNNGTLPVCMGGE
jgi:hypothetical protein